jgi:hypothetical protein
MKKRELIRDEWRVLSDKFVRHHRLPNGTVLVLEHRQAAGGARRRKARNDTTFTRHLFRGRAAPGETVADLINNYLQPALLVNLRDRGLRVQLRGPNGETPQGNTKISTVRNWPPLATPDEVEAQETLEWEINEISELADMKLRDAEEERDDSDRVLSGFMRALVRRYNATAVREVMERESLASSDTNP